MEKRTAKGRRKASQTRGVIVGQVQSGLLLGFGIVTLFIVFGAGVLVGMWYQASEYTTSYAAATSSTGQDPGAEHTGVTDAPKMTFYSTLQTHDPAPPTLSAPSSPSGVPLTPQNAPQQSSPLVRPSTADRSQTSTPAAAQSQSKVAAREPAAATSYYSVQVGSFRDAAEADKLRQRLVQKGYKARIRLFMSPGQGPWYRVRVGSFAERVAAEKAARRLRTRERMPAIVAVEAR